MSGVLIRQLAWRYLKGKRGANAVPVLSRISMVAIGVGAAAMIILFSVFNGFEGLVRDLYKAFYPELKITTAKGKFFQLSQEQYNKVATLEGVQVVSKVLEDNVFINSTADEKMFATIKGVDRNYFRVNDVATYVTEGDSIPLAGGAATTIGGTRLLSQLGLDVNNVFSLMQVYYPDPKASPGLIAQSPDKAFRSVRLTPTGAFTVQEEFDAKYLLADLSVVQQLTNEVGKYSSLELKLKPGTDDEDVQEQLQKILGTDYIVQTRFEQNKALYTVMRSEKWAVYGVLVLVLMIAAFNMVGALSLLVLEKQKDIGILKAMGANNAQINRLFLTEGALWALLGGGIGLTLGLLICVGQQQFGWIKLGGSFIIEAYPIRLQLTDFIVIIATILGIGLLAAWFPAYRAARAEGLALKTD